MKKNTLHISPDLALPLDWIQLATVVYGARGAGKTCFGRVAAEEATKARQRFCAIDLKGDWYGLKSSGDGKSEGIPVVIFGGEHADVPLEPDAGAFVGETVAKLEQSCILDFELFSKGKQIRFLADFFEALYHHNREPLLLLLDEAQRYAPQKPGPDEARTLGAVQDLVKLGRKHGIGPVLFTQRGAGLSKEVSELCDLLVAFRTPGPLDQDRIKDWLDANTTKVQRDEVMGKLSSLPTGTAVLASGHPELTTFGVYQIRRPETFDSSATPKIGQRRKEPKRLATPDLEVLRIKMAAAIERAKADDPRELRKRIAELEKELRAKPTAVAAPKRVEVPVVSADMAKRLEKVLDLAKTSTESALGLVDRLKEALAPIRFKAAETKKAPGFWKSGPMRTLQEADLLPVSKPTGNLPKGECAILIAVAQHPSGVTREQLTILTGYRRSTRDAYLQRLYAAGLARAGVNGTIEATASGCLSLGSDYQPLPTGRALLEHWLGRLPEGERRILEVAAEAFPSAVARDEIGERTGYKRSTRDAYLQRLGTRKLVKVDRGEIRLSEELVG